MLLHAAASSPLETIKVIVICIVLTLLEFAGVAVLVAPRAVARKLMSGLRALVRRLPGALGRSPSRSSAQASGKEA
jgi:threonine/homoserine/homoserine lactone efflux protein